MQNRESEYKRDESEESECGKGNNGIERGGNNYAFIKSNNGIGIRFSSKNQIQTKKY